MGSKVSASTVFIVSLNLVLFTLVSSQTPPTCPQDLGPCESAMTAAFFGAGPNPSSECCQRFQGLSDAGAAACFCQILKANRSRIPPFVSLSRMTNLFLRYCGRNLAAYNCV
ncbi:Disease Related Nonspecific Lipid Transfer Protein 1 [Hibiscus trionum]|uniref:Disease Related Nonspecific Lipid Transfer Protein 1 n=1 Tax=Hibiscus trionum TaxID=183268 RepID=A0A9W7JB87_HIBTR|nr:Disease Related Nonspecific Lipid Transfer Protein 1 [Hibiscus trionum]